MEKSKKKQIIATEIEISKIREPKFIAREEFGKDELQDLMDSISDHGLIHPIRLKTVKGGYEIVAGHRRFVAHKKLKLKTIRAEIVETNETEQEIVKLHENKKRVELTDIEEAKSFEHLKKITGKTNKQIAKEANVSEAYVTQRLEIMKYPDCLYNAIATQQITFSAARELVRIKDLKILEDYVDHACRSGITPKVAKEWAEDWLMMDKLNRGEITEAKKDVNYNPNESVKLPCFVCGHYFKVENTIMVRVCTKDSVAIVNATKELEKE